MRTTFLKALLPCGVWLSLASSALAQPYPAQIDLSWNDCVLGPYSVDMGNACTSNTGVMGTMFASFSPPGLLPRYEANASIIELQTSAATLSPWWHFEGGGCRYGLLSISGDFVTGPTSCADFWNGQALGGYNYGTPSSFGHPNTARIQTWMAFQEALAGPIDNTQMWYAYKLTILNQRTVGTGSCAGCLDAATIVLAQMNLSQPAPTPDIVLTSGPHQLVTYRGGPTPIHGKTWGAIKALYR